MAAKHIDFGVNYKDNGGDHMDKRLIVIIVVILSVVFGLYLSSFLLFPMLMDLLH